MRTINTKRFAFAVGFTAAILYIGCVLLVTFAGTEATASLFKNILHFIDLTQIMKNDYHTVDLLFGIIEVFIVGWLTGALIASSYNFYNFKSKKN